MSCCQSVLVQYNSTYREGLYPFNAGEGRRLLGHKKGNNETYLYVSPFFHASLPPELRHLWSVVVDQLNRQSRPPHATFFFLTFTLPPTSF